MHNPLRGPFPPCGRLGLAHAASWLASCTPSSSSPMAIVMGAPVCGRISCWPYGPPAGRMSCHQAMRSHLWGLATRLYPSPLHGGWGRQPHAQRRMRERQEGGMAVGGTCGASHSRNERASWLVGGSAAIVSTISPPEGWGRPLGGKGRRVGAYGRMALKGGCRPAHRSQPARTPLADGSRLRSGVRLHR